MKNFFEKLGEIKESPRGGAIFFFGFYLLFFIFVFLLIGSNNNDSLISKNYEGNKTVNYSGLVGKNYSFIYTINLDGVEYKYIGKQNGDKISFEINGSNYYASGNKYYLYENNNLMLVDKPYVIDSVFLDTDKVNNLFKLGSFDSKTEYDSGKKVFNYLISTNTINQYFYNIDSDYLENPNHIIISTNENNIVDKFVLNLDSFCLLNNVCQHSLKVELTYSNFGKIEEINNPIE